MAVCHVVCVLSDFYFKANYFLNEFIGLGVEFRSLNSRHAYNANLCEGLPHVPETLKKSVMG